MSPICVLLINETRLRGYIFESADPSIDNHEKIYLVQTFEQGLLRILTEPGKMEELHVVNDEGAVKSEYEGE